MTALDAAPLFDHPDLDPEARLIVVSGAMRSGKTSTGIRYAHELASSHVVEGFRPAQDTRSSRPAIESQHPDVRSFPAKRVHDLGGLATRQTWEVDAAYVDEPFFFAEADGSPDMRSFAGVKNALRIGGIVVVSTLDENYMRQRFAWFELLMEEGRRLDELGYARFQHVPVTGYCDLCDVARPTDANPSISTNLYVDGVHMTDGQQNIPDNGAQVYVPCCEQCRDVTPTLPAHYKPRFTIDHST